MSDKNKEAQTEKTEAAAVAGYGQPGQAQAQQPEPVKKSCSPGLTQWMFQQGLSLGFTSYQSSRMYLLGTDPKGRLSFHERIYQRAMGIKLGYRLFGCCGF